MLFNKEEMEQIKETEEKFEESVQKGLENFPKERKSLQLYPVSR